ncbi:hypothetical protein [Clostridium estertheticum]|uniref:hypothetical protein n=1 Tax=Clostridium estertheticum TaxID=238834 RepID=UPI001C6F2A9F|nr:hypothetical protein [Clostridium estertheticum]MBW9153852.1 hypothetical protein [Clostridium estertheticum]WLC86471.1 hypothetical protein KTC97_20245 [Clostridium estertheticum]
MKEQVKSPNSIIMGSTFWGIYWVGAGIFGVVTKRNGFGIGFFIDLFIGALGFIVLIYQLKKTKDNHNERYEDERKTFISEKSLSTSFTMLYILILLFQFLIRTGRINMNTDSVLSTLIIGGLIIQFISYLFYKFKY